MRCTTGAKSPSIQYLSNFYLKIQKEMECRSFIYLVNWAGCSSVSIRLVCEKLLKLWYLIVSLIGYKALHIWASSSRTGKTFNIRPFIYSNAKLVWAGKLRYKSFVKFYLSQIYVWFELLKIKINKKYFHRFFWCFFWEIFQ